MTKVMRERMDRARAWLELVATRLEEDGLRGKRVRTSLAESLRIEAAAILKDQEAAAKPPLVTFLAMGNYAWGRGPTIAEARKAWRKSGGTGKPKVYVFAYEDLGEDTVRPYVDAMGRILGQDGATFREVA